MESGLDVGFVEGAVVAVLWEIGVVLGEDGTGLGGVASETGMGGVARRRNRRERGLFFGRDGRGRLVGGGEGTLAVPAVAGAVLVPEGVVGIAKHLAVFCQKNPPHFSPLFSQQSLIAHHPPCIAKVEKRTVKQL